MTKLTCQRASRRDPERQGCWAVIGLILLIGSGCTALPRADDVAGITPDDVREGAASEQPVRWGGTIAGISNTDEGTTLEIVARPLRATGRPRHNDQTYGRFLARVPAFLDPGIVTVGRDITLTGTIDGTEAGNVGEAEYRYAVLAVDDYRYWRPEPRRVAYPHDYHPFLYGHAHPGWISDPWYPWYPYRHTPSRRPASGASVDF